MRSQDLMKRVKGPNDIPNGPHYAVIIYGVRSVYTPGDERSRTDPGHGYPGGTDYFDDLEHWVTTEKDYLEKFISDLEERTRDNRKPYVILDVSKKGNVARSTQVKF